MPLSLRNVALVLCLGLLLTDCAKWQVEPYDLVPQVKTGAASTPTTSVQVEASVDTLGPNTLKEFGIVYSAGNQLPTINAPDTKVPASGTGGSATVTLNGLQPSTTYYYRTYATNNKDITGYGETKSFKTPEVLPSVQTLDVIGTTATSTQIQCQVANAGSIALKEYGIVYSTTNQQPTTPPDAKAPAAGTGGKATVTLDNLQPNTTYYCRAYAITNSGAVGYGEAKMVKTGEPAAVVETMDVVGTPASTSAQVQCQVSNAGSITLKEYGIAYSATNPLPTTADGVAKAEGSGALAIVTLAGLQPNTTYNYRAYALNGAGTIYYGTAKSFKTQAAQPNWRQVASLPGSPRSDPGLIVIGSKMYMAGGVVAQGANTNEVWEFDAATGKWTQKANLPRRVAYGKGFSYNGLGYMVGHVDENQTPSAELLIYDPATDKWTTRPDNNMKRFLVSVALIANKAYIAGGRDQNTIVEYTINTGASRTIAANALTNLAIGVMFPFGDRIYMGNGNASGNFTKNAFELIPNENNKIGSKPDMPQTEMMGGVIVNNRTFAIGTTDSRLFEYKDDKWILTTIATGTPVRAGGSFFSIGNTIYYGFGYRFGAPSERKNDLWTIDF